MSTVLRQSLYIIGGKSGALILSVIITPVLARLLGSDGYGDFAFVMSLAVFATAVSGKDGVASGVRKYISEHRDVPQWESTTFAFYVRLSGVLVMLVAGLLAAIASHGLVERYLGTEYATYFYVLAGIVVTDQMFSLLQSTLLVFDLANVGEMYRVVRKGIYGLVGVALVYAGMGVSGALVGYLVGGLTAALGAMVYLKDYVSLGAVFCGVPGDFPRRELVGFAASTVVFLVLLVSLYHVDVLMLRLMTTDEETGLYRAALTTAEFLWFVPHAVQIALLHSMSELWEKEDRKQIGAVVGKTVRYTLVLTVLLAVGLATLSDEFVTVYFGAEYASAAGPLLLLLPGTIGFAACRPILSTVHGKGDLRLLILATGSAAAINATLNVILIPRYGMHGAALATSVGYGSMFAFHTWTAWTVGFKPLEDLRVVRIVASGAVMAAVIVPLAGYIESNVIALAVVPPAGLVVYLLAAIKLEVVDRDELKPLIRSIPFLPPL